MSINVGQPGYARSVQNTLDRVSVKVYTEMNHTLAESRDQHDRFERHSPLQVVSPLNRLQHPPISGKHVTSNSYGQEDNMCEYHSRYSDGYEQHHSDKQFPEYQDNRSNNNHQRHSEYLNYYPQTTLLVENCDYQAKYDRNTNQYYPDQNSLPYEKLLSADLSSLRLDWDNKSYESKVQNSQTMFESECYNHTTQKIDSSHLLDNFTKLGKCSPSLDQGYHTLVTPSPGHITPNPWMSANMQRGKKHLVKNNSFDRLSDELVIKVFSYLDSIDLSVCSRACKRFNILVWTPVLWRTVSLNGEHISGDKAIRGILRQLCGQDRAGACRSIERVRVSNGVKLSDKSLLSLARRCPELVHLQIQGCTFITNDALSEIASRCNNLQHLDVTGCINISCIMMNIGPEPPRRLHLQYLDLTDCPALEDSGLRVIVRNCPQLAYLYLRRCIQITDTGLKFVPSFCLGLRELSISDCSSITDFGLYELANLGATLRYLSVAKCDRVSDAGLKVIARRCYKLRYLNVRGCEAVSDDAITVLARSCPRLRALDIGKCDVSDAGLSALAESCPNLKKLSLRNCDLVTDRGVQCIAYYCRGLQQLNIQDCQISLEGYRAVKKYCKRCVIEHTNPGFF